MSPNCPEFPAVTQSARTSFAHPLSEFRPAAWQFAVLDFNSYVGSRVGKELAYRRAATRIRSCDAQGSDRTIGPRQPLKASTFGGGMRARGRDRCPRGDAAGARNPR